MSQRKLGEVCNCENVCSAVRSMTLYIHNTRVVPKVRGHRLIFLFPEYYSDKFFIL